MKVLLFPGQGSQYVGMGRDLYENDKQAKALFDTANEILGFKITDIMFNGDLEDLKQTDITQPSIYIHSVILFMISDVKNISAVAGHSLGEFSALVSTGSISFEDGLNLVVKRANLMQKACELSESSMAAILGVNDDLVETICHQFKDVVPANYNAPGQLVISGSKHGVISACEELKLKGAKAIILPVGGGFHSSFMSPAQNELADAINETNFYSPKCPVYQNYDANSDISIEKIKEKLILQLTSPVKWTQTIQNMVSKGMLEFVECGPGRVLQGLAKKINKEIVISSI